MNRGVFDGSITCCCL